MALIADPFSFINGTVKKEQHKHILWGSYNNLSILISKIPLMRKNGGKTMAIFTGAATAIITPIATSCSSNENNSISETNYYEEINNAEKHLITEQSAIDLNNLFNANINSRTSNINLLTKEEIAEKVVLDKENFIYKKLEENNLNKIFEESAIDVIYQSYLNQINGTQVDNNLSRCGSIFSKHF